ncbi:hypothetical protein HETIRDRAFT_450365 [Heterobasidion irregulare TC 32-1]|uniref:Uncharacterized protein n=1 Tax=Heterobasidion irregulare (strain TC 32-1) TaxID=747525 RepID=W4KAX9_HETIT|nr:uncharacterized protein HETIRDRAFT_450365 [Heterobasidion irregulare TC 32-1]ETW82520.1 hypothetical protein HETIRDRAFT_450365 [Heterobasidion irregulare TC 32-1]
MSDLPPAEVNIGLDLAPVSTSGTKADYTAENVPEHIKNKVIVGNVLYVDVVNVGAMVGTNLEDKEARNLGLIKNHWTFRALLDFGRSGKDDIGQVNFGMDVEHSASIGSNEGQCARSSRSDPESGSDIVYSPVTSFSKPFAPSSDGIFQAALPLVPATGDGSHGSFDSQSVVNSDVDSVSKPPNITSSDGVLLQQPTEGAPHPGGFNIKIRGRTEPSCSIIRKSA